ncbi:MAG: immune inhibitor A [Chloroflexi bacterium]|nr:immune inhibitor A [Chloroflexota bacterium]
MRASVQPLLTPTLTPSPTPPLSIRLRDNPMPPRNTLLSSAMAPWPTTLDLPAGAQKRFWIHDVEPNGVRQITACLHITSTYLQMWVEYGLEVDDEALMASATFFDEQIYPTNRRYFGHERSPGIDGDRRLLVLNARFAGAAGYFASANGYPRSENPYSNEHEMFVMNLSALEPGSATYNSVLAHEFQHMIHWSTDSNEAAWINEGASELAEDLNGFSRNEAQLRAFGRNPDLQLNHWPADDDRLGAHYAASYLLLRYLLDRYGAEAVRALIQQPQDGVDGLDAVLAEVAPGTTFDDFFGEWLLANALDLPGPFGYPTLEMSVEPERVVESYPFRGEGRVHQYGADYWELKPAPDQGALAITFAGAPTVRVVPNEPVSGRYQWWSNRGDLGHSYLQRSLDLRGATTATLSFWLWFDVEPGWDYGYVRVSPDGGQTWEFLRGSYTSDYDPNRVTLGPGYTGKSGLGVSPPANTQPVWVHESLDLSAWAGQEILLRVDYVTDDAVNLPGLCLDDICLTLDADIGFLDTVEEGEEGWRAVGFIRHDNRLAQRYLLQFVRLVGDELQVTPLPVGEDGHGRWQIPALGADVRRALLVIAGITRYTTEPATYTLEIGPHGPSAP